MKTLTFSLAAVLILSLASTASAWVVQVGPVRVAGRPAVVRPYLPVYVAPRPIAAPAPIYRPILTPAPIYRPAIREAVQDRRQFARESIQDRREFARETIQQRREAASNLLNAQ
jgi:hypothetical protein